jgi:hypothetical protein
LANGITILGKYTLPNMAALPINVLDVAVSTLEKYVHITIPDI